MITRLCLFTTIVALISTSAFAAGVGQGGRDVYHTPMSWCAVAGSPAADSPNITPEGSTTADTNTDAILWRRHERPTDNIFLPQTDITLRSAINDAWGSLNFPIIADPDTSTGTPGDVRGEANTALGAGSEYQDVLTACEDAWADLGRAGIGITAVNINMFTDGNGDYINAAGQGFPIGWGGCVRPVGSTDCSEPYDGTIMVIDNTYLYPTVADRTFRPSPNDPGGTLAWVVTDPLDQLVGHEVGHALGLPHRDTDSNNLMFFQTSDNSGDGRADNVGINGAETTITRDNADDVGGVQIDPPNQINPGDFAAMALVDKELRTEGFAAHEDATVAKLMLNKKTGLLYISLRMRGVMQEENIDPRNILIGVNARDGQQFSFDQRTNDMDPLAGMEGMDSIFIVQASTDSVQGTAVAIANNETSLLTEVTDFSLRRLTMYPHYAQVKGQQGNLTQPSNSFDIADIVTIAVPADRVGVVMNEPFRVNIASIRSDGAIDFLETEETGRDLTFVMEDAILPKCFAQQPAPPGGAAQIRVEGLTPSAPIHALVGPIEVYKGATDASGDAVFNLPIPSDAREGLHLVTVGVDDTAFTADCVVDVDKDAPGVGSPVIDDKHERDGACCYEHYLFYIIFGLILIVILLIILIALKWRR
ncbi:MAG: hypothetical protein AAGJ73_16045 [Pseudomonadota bacterium]